MPTVILSNGYRIMIYTRDHEPMHVHVEYQGRKAVIEFEPEVRLRNNLGLNRNELRGALAVVNENRSLLIEKWREIYG
jgi:hypothetical protein